VEIIVAGTAGFCFGVSNALRMINKLIEDTNEPIYSLGPIIHNEQVVESLAGKGVKIIEEPDGNLSPGANMVIRAHGVEPGVYEKAEKYKLNTVDATCPYVKKIHQLVKEKYEQDCQIVIVGDRNHPEVRGINGWCGGTAYVVDSVEDVQALPGTSKKVCVVAQTTLSSDRWENINECLKNKFENIIKFDTICNATSKRQKEAAAISKKADVMFVVGGRHSSNTQKLFEICRQYCGNTYKIEKSGDIPPLDIRKIKKVGITAGASTPDWIIKEVIDKMEELNKKENEISFKEAYENSIVDLRSGTIVKGRIIGYNNSEVFVDMGFKSDGIIPMEEFTGEPDFKPGETLKEGDIVDVYVVKVNDGEGNVLLSKKKVDAMRSWEKIEESYENKAPVKAKVIEVVNGGIIASLSGVRIFVPASQVSDRYVKDLKEFLNKTVSLRIIEFNRQKRKIVGSQRVLIEEEKAKLMDDVWKNIEPGKKYNGVVKSLTDFGAFVDIGGVDGLIHVSELSWGKIKHPSEVLRVGDNVEVTVLEFDKDKNRISLGFRKAEDNPWYNASQKYRVGDVVKGKVVRLVPFGAFLELEDGIDGLVHISQISSSRIGKPGDVLQLGQVVEAKIIEANYEAKKINLSIKEVNPIEIPAVRAGADTAEEAESLPTEHKEETPVTISELVSGIKIDEQASGQESAAEPQ